MTSELETLRADVADLCAKRRELQRLLAESISREQSMRHALTQALTVAPGAPMLAHVGQALRAAEVGARSDFTLTLRDLPANL